MSPGTGNWDEIRTAYQVARLGTVSGAADVLGVHHATVIRHVDALEARLGVKLFQRHSRGYTPTEAGRDLMRVAAATDDQLTQLVGRLQGRRDGVSGELIVTTINGLSDLLTPALARFRERHPEVTIRYVTDSRLFRLEYGEAHVAIRAGARPEQPDNVVQPFLTMPGQLCAARSYAERHGLPANEAELRAHRFVATADEYSRAPITRWMKENLPAENIVYRASEAAAVLEAVRAGVGIGFATCWWLRRHDEVVPVLASREEWAAQLWLVTHVDLHRSSKVQAIVRFLKEEAKTWDIG